MISLLYFSTEVLLLSGASLLRRKKTGLCIVQNLSTYFDIKKKHKKSAQKI